jgi:HK97 family phage portal protein
MWSRIVSLADRWWTPRASSHIVIKSNAGEVVTPDIALKQAVVWACVRYLSQTVAQLPWRTLLDTESGVKEMRGLVTARALRLRPNPECSPFTLKECLVGWACTWGNGIAELVRNQRGEVVEIWPIHPQYVTPERDKSTGELLYRVWFEHGGSVYLRAQDVLHIRGFGDGAWGLSVIEYAAQSIGWARATEKFGATYFGQGTAPSGVLTTGMKLTPGGKEALERELKDKFSGASNAHRTIIMDSQKATYARLQADPQVAQLIETRQHQVDEICRWFGVPPHKVAHLLRATFSNIEHQSIEVVVDSITPWCLRLEEEANWKLFGNNRQGVYTKLDTKGLLRGDFKTRQEGLQIMRRNGVITADQWATLEDQPMPGSANGGDLYIVESNMVKMEDVGEQPDAAGIPQAGNPGYSNGNEADPADESPVDIARRQRAEHGIEGLH